MRYTLLLVCGLGALLSQARPVSLGEAAKIASIELRDSKEYKFRAPGIQRGEQYAPYYVFNSTEGNGYVIVAGDDGMPAVLGKVDKGTFDEASIPPQMEFLLETYAEAYEALRDEPQEPWNASKLKQREPLLLKTALFGQNAPFNNYCPNSSVTGCGATATAILMKYYNYPPKGKGSHTYVSNGTTVTRNFEYDFNWDDILDDYTNGYTTAQADAVANLMFSVGAAIEMQYTKSESSSDAADIVRLAKYFRYKANPQYLRKQDLNEEDWEDKLNEEMDARGPVIFRGAKSDNTGGHIFIIDGRDDEGRYHINWGWNGSSNGYFYLTNLTPGSSHQYSYRQGFVYDVVPEETDEFHKFIFSPSFGQGLVMNAEHMEVGERYSYSLTGMQNVDDVDHTGTVGILLVDSNYNVKDVLASSNLSLRSGYYYTYQYYTNWRLDVEPEEGDKVIVGYIVSGEEANGWRPVYGYFGTQSELDPLNNKVEYAELEWHLDENLVFDVLFPDFYSVQKGFPLRFSFLYNTDVTEITVTINGEVVEPNNDMFGEYRIHSVSEDKYVIDVKTNLYKESGIALTEPESDDAPIEIYDINGRKMAHTNKKNIDNDTRTLAPGVYLKRTASGTTKWVKK